MPRYEHAGAAVPTTLSSSIDSTTDTISVDDSSGWPTGATAPFWAVIDAGTASEEKILVTSLNGTTLTDVERGADSTTATSHAAGATVAHCFTATEADEDNVATVAVEALTSPLVGEDDEQTLTGKTLTEPTVTDPTVTDGTFTDPTLVRPLGVPWGVLGYAQVTSNQSGIGTSATDLTGLTVTVTVGSGRRIRVTSSVRLQQASGSPANTAVNIQEGATILQSEGQTVTVDTAYFGWSPSVILTPSAGSHTYNLAGSTSAGTVAVIASSQVPAYILVEDLGAA